MGKALAKVSFDKAAARFILVGSTLSMSGNVVRIDCSDSAEAHELYELLERLTESVE